jgi:hypothetical protein
MCLPVSRLFWVSSLAYPNLLGTKDYVVVYIYIEIFYIIPWVLNNNQYPSPNYRSRPIQPLSLPAPGSRFPLSQTSAGSPTSQFPPLTRAPVIPLPVFVFSSQLASSASPPQPQAVSDSDASEAAESRSPPHYSARRRRTQCRRASPSAVRLQTHRAARPDLVGRRSPAARPALSVSRPVCPCLRTRRAAPSAVFTDASRRPSIAEHQR